MKPDREKHYRRSIRLRDFDYSQSGFYFLSICSHNRALMFGEVVDGRMSTNKFGQILETYWDQLPERFPGAESVAFLVMPNHVHGIIHIVGAITSSCGHELLLQEKSNKTPRRVIRRKMLIPKIVGWFKMNTAKRINKLKNTQGSSVWQRNYWEHVIRNQESLNRIYEYIQTNPARWYLDKNNPKRVGDDEFDLWMENQPDTK